MHDLYVVIEKILVFVHSSARRNMTRQWAVSSCFLTDISFLSNHNQLSWKEERRKKNKTDNVPL